MSNLSTFRAPSLKTATGSLTYSANTGVVTYTAPTKLSQFTNDLGFVTASALTNSLELGSTTAVNTPYIDFHSSGGANDWDSRLIASGGSVGTNNTGTLSMYGAGMVFNAPVTAGSGATSLSNINLTLSETANASSRRASLQIGQGWQVGQDVNTNGTRDFYIFNNNTSKAAMTFDSVTNAAIFGGSISTTNLYVPANTDAIITLEDTGAASNTYRRKAIYSSRNVTGGNDWLFRHTRPSDGASEDFLLKQGSGGNIWTTGNFTPGNYALLAGNNTFTGFNNFTNGVAVTPSVNLMNSNSSVIVYTDVGSNNVSFRTGTSGSYKYTTMTAAGDLSVNNGNIYATGSINGTGGNFSSDVHTARGNNNVGYYYAGNANNAYYGFDGSSAVIRAASAGNIYRITDNANYMVFDQCSLWGSTRSWYGSSTPTVGATQVTNAPALNLQCAAIAMGSNSNGGYGALRIQSNDTNSTSGAFMEFLNQNRFGGYFGLDSDNQFKVGGWSFGAAAYRVHHFGNCNPIIDIRLVYAGDQTGAAYNANAGGAIWEPYGGSVISGAAVTNVSGTYVLVNTRWRYLQKQDAYGAWYTVAYA